MKTFLIIPLSLMLLTACGVVLDDEKSDELRRGHESDYTATEAPPAPERLRLSVTIYGKPGESKALYFSPSTVRNAVGYKLIGKLSDGRGGYKVYDEIIYSAEHADWFDSVRGEFIVRYDELECGEKYDFGVQALGDGKRYINDYGEAKLIFGVRSLPCEEGSVELKE